MSDLSDTVFAIPTWLAIFLALFAPALVVAALWLLSRVVRRVSAWADREITDALASPASITEGFTDMGEQAAEVAWIFGDQRPRLTVIDGGSGEAA